MRKVFAILLTDLGCEVTQAADAADAMHRFASAPWDLLVTDLNLGSSIDGEEVARKMTRRIPRLPVLYVSSDCSAFKGEVGPNQRLLQKPIAASQFAEAVEELLATD